MGLAGGKLPARRGRGRERYRERERKKERERWEREDGDKDSLGGGRNMDNKLETRRVERQE